MPGPTDIIWPLVIVGRGSSAAYYVTTVDLNLYKNVLAIGEDDAWAGVRGHSGNATDPTLKINHPLHLIQHFKETIPGFETELVDRLKWAEMNASVLAQANVQIHKATVQLVSACELPKSKGIELDRGVQGFQIKLASGDLVHAYKVVLCAGQGGHRVPRELTAAKSGWPKQVIDLDEFARLPASALTPATEVVVIGANAAIDAVHKALNYKCKINWLIQTESGKAPPMLATQPRMLQAWEKPLQHKLNVYRYEKYESRGRTGTQIGLNTTLRPSGQKMVYGDYIVYGVGPDGEPVKLIDNTIKANLKPIVDSTRSLNNDARTAATILGFEAEGTGLLSGIEVVGALSVQVGRDVAAQRVQSLPAQIEVLRKDKRIFEAISTTYTQAGIKPFLAKAVEFLAKQPRAALHGQLQSEIRSLKTRYMADTALASALEGLANLILAYQCWKQYRDLLDQVATNLPKGTVADSGQLTSILSSLGAYATIRGFFPKYMPKQQFTTPGPIASGQKAQPIAVTNTPGSVNFNIDNAQNIAIYICLAYPNIPPEKANLFMDELMAARHNSNTGFNNTQVMDYQRRLATMDLEGLKARLQ